MIVEIDVAQAALILDGLDKEWVRLGLIRDALAPPDDGPYIQKQNEINEIQTVIRGEL